MSPSPHAMGGVETFKKRRASPQCHKGPRQLHLAIPNLPQLAAGEDVEGDQEVKPFKVGIDGAKRGNEC